MHLLAARPGGFVDDEGIIDLEQSAADIIILSASDGSLASLAEAQQQLLSQESHQKLPTIRLANWINLSKPAAFDLYEHKVLDSATLVILSLLGGEHYWEYGFERLQHWAKIDNKRTLIIVPGDDNSDPALETASNITAANWYRVWRYLREGTLENSYQLLRFIGTEYFNQQLQWQEPIVLAKSMLYMPIKLQNKQNSMSVSLSLWQQRWQQQNNPDTPVCALLFYRSHLQNNNTAMFDGIIAEMEHQGLNPLPIALTSLKDDEAISLTNWLIEQSNSCLILNTTGFAANNLARDEQQILPNLPNFPFSKAIPVLQLILSSSTEQDWQQHTQGLRSRDLAMQVVLPEIDGRIITRAISFKQESHFDQHAELTIVRYKLQQERAAFVVELAAKYAMLAQKPNAEKRIALILANYPTNDGRIGNGVGLDTPASVINILTALAKANYPVEAIPNNGNELIEELLKSITNNQDNLQLLPCNQSISLDEYNKQFNKLPSKIKQQIYEQWGAVEQDPKYRSGRLMLAGIRLGETFVGIQPARGFNIDLAANYHSPDLIPPHNYLAFYFWLRYIFQVDAIIHVGKHGNLEWLPGKGLALSNQCLPDLILGAMPHFYPFIVNDPGEGSQAKRRTQAVIIDHLMPPMTRAETYGELAELEMLVDEYYQAQGMDERREDWLRAEIIKQLKQTNVLQELTNIKINKSAEHIEYQEKILSELDAWLCDIKEAQIRHGLHILGQLPDNKKLAETLVALLRLPRGTNGHQQGILHNLSHDLKLYNRGKAFDPLIADTSPWQTERPALLQQQSEQPWRTEADTRERLELLAIYLINKFILDGEQITTTGIIGKLTRTRIQLEYARDIVHKLLQQSVFLEIDSLIQGLNAKFVPAGASGAPTRGRLDTLPTGRNFFSIDNRAIPSPAAWQLGKLSAQALIKRHLQIHGDYPKQLGLSVWGTATMRTGGDDIAQAFALMGVEPIWAQGSNRVIDFKLLSSMQLGRPRVDVTLRISGFFRDAFPNVIRLYDAAVQAIAKLDEPGNGNSIKININQRSKQLIAAGVNSQEAWRQASFRVFGSKPGSYGAGLQGLIDERCWESADDLAEAWLNWGGYAYGVEQKEGVMAREAFSHRLSQLEVVIQNQDNREHDILDSDDYYQFQGGMTNAVSVLRGQAPVVYHNDHSNPELPKIRTLKEELNRVIRSRLLNPKWISAMQAHGYKGAFEMAASVDYLFAYDATTNLIDDYQYQQVADSLIFDIQNREFIQQNNPNALENMAERLLEAIQRGLWQTSGNYSQKLQQLLLELDEQQESAD